MNRRPRPFEFDGSTKERAFIRQWNRCACCRRNLNYLIDHAHHVIPNQTGIATDPADKFLKEIDNCVIICEDCHERVHEDGRYRIGAVAPAEYFPYSHGSQTSDHTLWVDRVNAHWRRISQRGSRWLS